MQFKLGVALKCHAAAWRKDNHRGKERCAEQGEAMKVELEDSERRGSGWAEETPRREPPGYGGTLDKRRWEDDHYDECSSQVNKCPRPAMPMNSIYS